jgi:hypothetical protein
MRLFTIGSDFQAELNIDWLSLVPEFSALLRRDKGSKGDYRGEKKLKARREFTFIYFDLDFTSPLKEYEEFERRQQALHYAGLTESDLDEAVMAAHKEYNNLLMNSSRSLKTLRAVKKSLDQLDKYFEEIDFSKVDKMGKLLHTTDSYLKNLKTLKGAYDSVDEFEDRVKQELTGDGGIRGNASLGGKEGKRDNTWTEAPEETKPETEPETKSDIEQISFAELGDLIKGMEKEEETE